MTYAINKFGDRIIVFGHSQGGIVASKVASIDSRIKATIAHNVIILEISGAEKLTNLHVKMTPLKKKIFKTVSTILAKLFPTKLIKATEYINNVDQTAEQKKRKKN